MTWLRWFVYWIWFMAWLATTMKIFTWGLDQSLPVWEMVSIGWLSFWLMALWAILSRSPK